MTSLIGGDETEVISIRKSDKPLVFQFIAKPFFFLFEGLEDGVEDHEEDYGTKGIPLEDSSAEAKRF